MNKAIQPTAEQVRKWLLPEQQIIHLMLKDRRAIAFFRKNGVAADWFDENHRLLVEAIYDHAAQGCLLSSDAYRHRLIQAGFKKQAPLLMEVFAKCDIKAWVDMNDMPILLDALKQTRAVRAVNAFLKDLTKDGALATQALLSHLPNLQSVASVCHSGQSIADYVSADAVAPRKVEWLWRGRLALGKTNLLSGEGGVGKGALTMDIAARISNGTPMPITGEVTSGKVIILSAEDDKHDTIRPRLEAAGANLKNVLLVNGKRDGSDISLDTDLHILEQILIAEPEVKLVVIDPISAYTGKVRDEEVPVRNFLKPIERMAQKYKVAVLLLKHYKKGVAKAKERTSGTIAWVNSVRVALGVSPDPADDETKHLYLIKGNNAKAVKSLTYRTVSSDYDPDVVAVQWGGETEYKADDFCAQEADQGKLQQAVALLTVELASGPRLFSDLEALCAEHDISKRTLWRAKEKMGLKPQKNGFQGPWMWALADQPKDSQEPKGCQIQESVAAFDQAKDLQAEWKESHTQNNGNLCVFNTANAVFRDGLASFDEEIDWGHGQ